MEWVDTVAKFLPAMIALIGIPLAAWLTWLREKNLHQQQQRREDALRQAQEEREDRLREEQQRLAERQRRREQLVAAFAHLLAVGEAVAEKGRRRRDQWRRGELSTAEVGALKDEFVELRGTLLAAYYPAKFMAPRSMRWAIGNYVSSVEGLLPNVVDAEPIFNYFDALGELHKVLDGELAALDTPPPSGPEAARIGATPAQVAPNDSPTIERTPAPHRPLQGRWRRLWRWLAGRRE